MSSIITSNMSLIIPGVGSEAGPTYASDINSSLQLIDQHDHSPGYGVQITPVGLNINTDLTFAGNQATNVKAILFTNQASLATVNALYTIGGELWYNDPTNPVQITSAGGVNATSSGISSGTASAAFSGSGPYTLVINSAANTPASTQMGSVLLGNNTALSKFLTLQPPLAMAADYNVTLPPLATGTQYMTLGTSGSTATMGSVATIPGSVLTSGTVTTTQIASATILTGNIASATIIGANIAANTVTRGLIGAPNFSVSNSSGGYTNAGGNVILDVPNLTTTLTLSSTSKGVMMMLQSDGSSNEAYMHADGETSLYFYANGGVVATYRIGDNVYPDMPIPITLSAPAFPNSNGSITYKIAVNPHTATFTINNARLFVWEI